MPREVVRTIEAYSIHGFEAAGAPQQELLDYGDFFAALREENARVLRFDVGGDVVAIPEKESSLGRLALRFVTGNPEELPLVYDLDTATAAAGDPGAGKVVVRSAWVIVVPAERLIFVEKRRPGVPIFQIEQFLARYGRERLGIPGLTISLNPVASGSFLREVERFTRIREASIVVRRPNHSWTSTAEELIGGPAAESNAAEVTIDACGSGPESVARPWNCSRPA